MTVYAEEHEVKKVIMLMSIWLSCHESMKKNVLFNLVTPSSLNLSHLSEMEKKEDFDCSTLVTFDDSYKNYVRLDYFFNDECHIKVTSVSVAEWLKTRNITQTNSRPVVRFN